MTLIIKAPSTAKLVMRDDTKLAASEECCWWKSLLNQEVEVTIPTLANGTCSNCGNFDANPYLMTLVQSGGLECCLRGEYFNAASPNCETASTPGRLVSHIILYAKHITAVHNTPHIFVELTLKSSGLESSRTFIYRRQPAWDEVVKLGGGDPVTVPFYVYGHSPGQVTCSALNFSDDGATICDATGTSITVQRT